MKKKNDNNEQINNNEKNKLTRKKKKPNSQNKNQKNSKDGKNNAQQNSKQTNGQLKIIPLGGMREIGKNITVFEYQNEIVIIDCGMAFPGDDLLGVDIVLPDWEYLIQNKKKIKGIFFTHGHEDHIGAVPYFLKDIDNVTLYGTKLTLGLIDNKLKEHKLSVKKQVIAPGMTIKVGKNFKMDVIKTTHSIADAVAYFINTPAGRVFHTGDFKIDHTPVDGQLIDFNKITTMSHEGVDLMLSDSTNASAEGYTKSEGHIVNVMERLFDESKGSRVIVATFASNIHRVVTIIETSIKMGRKVALSGRSVEKNIRTAKELGYIKYPEDVFVNIKQTKDVKDENLTIITTGSQGEAMSALYRIATGNHSQISIRKGDKIILSSSPIPGNEKAISFVINKCFELGAEVLYSELADVHVSGHAKKEELKLMLSMVRPKFFMPVHGEYKHLVSHKKIANAIGIKDENIFIPKNGDALWLSKKGIVWEREAVKTNPVYVDGVGVGDIEGNTVRDRRIMSESGVITISCVIDMKKRKIVSIIDVHARGFIIVSENENLMLEIEKTAKDKITEMLSSKNKDVNSFRSAVKGAVSTFIRKKRNKTPMVVISILSC